MNAEGNDADPLLACWYSEYRCSSAVLALRTASFLVCISLNSLLGLIFLRSLQRPPAFLCSGSVGFVKSKPERIYVCPYLDMYMQYV